MSNPAKIPSYKLKGAILEVAPFASVFVPDRSYSLASSHWFDAFNLWFRGKMFDFVGDSWDQRFDCDDFARFFAAFCQLANYRTRHDSRAEGLAVGEVFFRKDNGGGHAINVAMTEKGIQFIEPQNGDFIGLSQTEKQSIWFVRF